MNATGHEVTELGINYDLGHDETRRRPEVPHLDPQTSGAGLNHQGFKLLAHAAPSCAPGSTQST